MESLGYKAPFRLKSGKETDAVNLEQSIVRELKPNNPRAIKRGEKQAQQYAAELEKEYGRPFKWIVDVY